MFETLIVLGVVAVLVASGTAVLMLPGEILLAAGFGFSLLGLLVGAPAGFYYHVLLRSFLLRQPPLPTRWWLNPTRYHDRLSEAEARRMLPWFWLGAFGFFISMTGAFVAMLGVLALPW